MKVWLSKDMRENRQKKLKFLHIEHWQVVNAGLIIYDILAVNAAFFLALWVRFDCMFSEIPEYYLDSFLKFAPIYTIVSILIFFRCRLYQSIWRFASYNELLRVSMATVVTGMIQLAGTLIFVQRMPISYYMFGILLQFFAVLGIRFSYRFILLMKRIRRRVSNDSSAINVMIIGAGAAGQIILKDLSRTEEANLKVCCFIDDTSRAFRLSEGAMIS